MTEPTGTSLGDLDYVPAVQSVTVARHTPIGAIGDPALRDAIGLFETALTGLTAPLFVFSAAPAIAGDTVARDGTFVTFEIVSMSGGPAHGPTVSRDAVAEETDDAVAVIAQLVDRLGVPFRDVIAAAGIKKSTFYSWKLPHSPRPRLSSQGQLWALVQTVDDLDETLGGGIRRWLRMDAHRRTLLKAGNFGGLLALVTADRPRPASAEYVAAYAVGGDRDASAPELTPRAPVRRKAVTAQVRGAAHRRHG